jgi:hypothetical protein
VKVIKILSEKNPLQEFSFVISSRGKSGETTTGNGDILTDRDRDR